MQDKTARGHLATQDYIPCASGATRFGSAHPRHKHHHHYPWHAKFLLSKQNTLHTPCRCHQVWQRAPQAQTPPSQPMACVKFLFSKQNMLHTPCRCHQVWQCAHHLEEGPRLAPLVAPQVGLLHQLHARDCRNTRALVFEAGLVLQAATVWICTI